MKKELKDLDTQELIYELLAERVGTVTPKEVFSIVENPQTGKYTGFMGKTKLSKGELSQLKQEVSLVENMLLWQVLTKTLQHTAELKMLRHAKTERDMDWGKALMYAVSVFENTLQAINNCVIDEK